MGFLFCSMQRAVGLLGLDGLVERPPLTPCSQRDTSDSLSVAYQKENLLKRGFLEDTHYSN